MSDDAAPGSGRDPQDELAELTAQLELIRERNPLYFFHSCETACGRPGCRPHPKQHFFLLSRDQIKAFLGGNRSGKTTAGIVDDLIQACDRDAIPPWLAQYKKWEPPFYCRICAPDYAATLEGVIYEKIRQWAPKDQLLGGSWDKAYDKQLRKLRFKNGSWFQFLSYEQDLDKFSGAALHRVHCDEEPPEKVRQENGARLIDYGGDELFTMTPLLGMTWMYDQVFMQRHTPGITAVQVDMDDNPWLDEATKQAFLARLPDKYREARKSGKFVHFAGLVFEDFDPIKTTIPPIARQSVTGQHIVVGIDPGARWTGVSWIAFDDDNDALTFEELYLTDANVQQVCQAIKAKNKLWGIEPAYYVIDPSARNRQIVGGSETITSEFNRFGIYPSPAQNQVEAGILLWKRRMANKAWLVTQNCTALQDQLIRYRYDPKASDEGRVAVVKMHDHVLDANRYALMERAWGPPAERPTGKGRKLNDVWPGLPMQRDREGAPSTGAWT